MSIAPPGLKVCIMMPMYVPRSSQGILQHLRETHGIAVLLDPSRPFSISDIVVGAGKPSTIQLGRITTFYRDAKIAEARARDLAILGGGAAGGGFILIVVMTVGADPTDQEPSLSSGPNEVVILPGRYTNIHLEMRPARPAGPPPPPHSNGRRKHGGARRATAPLPPIPPKWPSGQSCPLIPTSSSARHRPFGGGGGGGRGGV